MNFQSKSQKKQKQLQTKPEKLYKQILRLPSVKIKNSDPNYQIHDLIGEGAFAKVRKAIRKVDGLQCVIKIYDKFRINTEQRKKAIKSQIEILKNANCKAVIGFLQWYEAQGTINIVMESFSNISLATYAKQNHPLPQQQLRKITKDIIQGINYLHQNGIAHRDIKPQNVLIKKLNGEVILKIIDFGLGMLAEQREIPIAGTPHYMPPQLLKRQKKPFDPFKADIWSAGITLYFVAMGYLPPKKRPVQFPVDIDPGMEYLLQKMFREDPQERVSANDILNDTWIKPVNIKAEIKRLHLGINSK